MGFHSQENSEMGFHSQADSKMHRHSQPTWAAWVESTLLCPRSAKHASTYFDRPEPTTQTVPPPQRRMWAARGVLPPGLRRSPRPSFSASSSLLCASSSRFSRSRRGGGPRLLHVQGLDGVSMGRSSTTGKDCDDTVCAVVEGEGLQADVLAKASRARSRRPRQFVKLAWPLLAGRVLVPWRYGWSEAPPQPSPGRAMFQVAGPPGP